jgi:transcriptional regulator with XRE-family HTH domain
MRNDRSSVGPVLRRLRTERELALAAVASQAGISVATLSRIETNKQSIEVGVLLTLAGILGVSAADILRDGEEKDDLGSLARRIGTLSPVDRTKLFLDASRRPVNGKQLGAVLDDLLSTVEMLRQELLTVQRSLDDRGRKR